MQVGDRIGEYCIAARLGAGGFGEVYRAHDVAMKRDVAIKVLHARHTEDSVAVERFLVEARAVARLDDPHVVRIHALGRLDDGRHYQVMELLAGETLERWIEAHEPAPRDEVLRILGGLARGLDAAHALSIVHRDIKPENIVLVPGESGLVPRLIDFGLVKLLPPPNTEQAQQLTVSGHIMGTPAYMSPEQCRGRAVDVASDVYSFGVVAYRLLTGSLPFEADDPLELLLCHARETPETPSAREPALPTAVDEVLLPLLDKDPARRPRLLVPVVAAIGVALGAPARAKQSRRKLVLAGAGVAAIVPVLWLAGHSYSGRTSAETHPESPATLPTPTTTTDAAPAPLPDTSPTMTSEPVVVPTPKTPGTRVRRAPSNPEAVEDPFRAP